MGRLVLVFRALLQSLVSNFQINVPCWAPVDCVWLLVLLTICLQSHCKQGLKLKAFYSGGYKILQLFGKQ